MSDFYKKFLLEDLRRMGANSGRQVFLAAFGKHPGWDDHVEDLGLESDSLIFAKTRLYVEGIGGQIDSGAWEKLDAQQQIPAFKHLFLWQRGAQFLIGRMWASSDGKGRTRYPMIVCAHCLGVPLNWVIDYALPRLEKIEQDCLLTKSPADVRSILSNARTSLRNALNDVGTEIIPTPPLVSREALAEFVAHPALGPLEEGWYRILYQMQSQAAAYAPGKFSLKGDLTGLRPQQLRVPNCAGSPAQAIMLWTRFFQTQLDPGVPFLLMLPLEQPWVDVTLGEPTSHEFFCLRASPKAVSLVSEVPFNLDADFRQRAGDILQNFQHGRGPGAASALPKTAIVPGAPPKSKFLKWFGGGAALILVVGIAMAFVFRSKDRTPEPVPSKPPQASAPVPAASAQPVLADSRTAQEQIRLVAEAQAREKARVAAEAETKRLLAEKETAAEKAKAEASARAAADAEKARLAADAEAKRKADMLAKETAAAQARLQAEKAQADAQAKTVLLASAERSAPTGAGTTVSPAASAQATLMTNSIGMVLVRLSPNYWAGKFEVTQGEYEKMTGNNPSRSKSRNDPLLPVESITWNEAMKFCEQLTAREKAAGLLPAGTAYTLPGEKQWNELLSDAKFDGAVTSDGGKRDGPAPVGSASAPNKLGLFDLFGNVWEWTLDEGDAHQKLILGGAYNSLKGYALKRQLAPDKQSANIGFRCILVPQP